MTWLQITYAQHLAKCPGCEWVFQEDGDRIKSSRKAWASARKRTGVPGLLFHDLRRSAVRNMERAGIPGKTAMAISGHKTEAIYWRYAMSSDRDVREAGRILARDFEEMRTVTVSTPEQQRPS